MCHSVEKQEENARKYWNNNTTKASTSERNRKRRKKDRQSNILWQRGRQPMRWKWNYLFLLCSVFFCVSASQRLNTFWHSNMMLRSAFGFVEFIATSVGVLLLHAVYIGLCGLRCSISFFLSLSFFHFPQRLIPACMSCLLWISLSITPNREYEWLELALFGLLDCTNFPSIFSCFLLLLLTFSTFLSTIHGLPPFQFTSMFVHARVLFFTCFRTTALPTITKSFLFWWSIFILDFTT